MIGNAITLVIDLLDCEIEGGETTDARHIEAVARRMLGQKSKRVMKTKPVSWAAEFGCVLRSGRSPAS
jgi:hypothetical protein